MRKRFFLSFGLLIAFGSVIVMFNSCDTNDDFLDVIPENDMDLYVYVVTAGTLPSVIAENEKYKIGALTLKGNLNGTDIRYIREMAGRNYERGKTDGKLANLNLAEVNIVSGGVSYTTYTYGAGYVGLSTENNIIGRAMFYGCGSLKNIVLPNSVREIQTEAFAECTDLMSVTFGKNNNIYNNVGVFGGCGNIETLNLGDCSGYIYSSNLIAQKEFIVSEQNQSYSAIDGVLFNKDKTQILRFPTNKSDATYIIPASVTLIGRSAFFGCSNLTNITIPDNVTAIVDYAFSYCTNASFTIKNSIASVGKSAFSGCTKLTSITITEAIWESAFYDCTGLTNVTIGNSVTSIGQSAFGNCTGLSNVIIGNSVTGIGQSAFGNCLELTEIHCKGTTPPFVVSNCFYNVDKTTCKLYVPKGYYTAYWIAPEWSEFDNIIEEENVTTINPINKDNITFQSISNGIAIETKEQMPVTVYNLSGQKVYQNVVSGNVEICLNKGVYILKINDESEKVIVK